MTLIENILELVSGYIESSDKRTSVYKTLKNLQDDIIKLKNEEDDLKPNRSTAYHCSICENITIRLYNKKYCLNCYDKYID